MSRNKLLMTTAAACLVVGLAGCGGDDDTPAPVPVTTAVPPSASASVEGFIGYLKQLVVASADTLEPVDISAVTPPTSDTTEPDSLN